MKVNETEIYKIKADETGEQIFGYFDTELADLGRYYVHTNTRHPVY